MKMQKLGLCLFVVLISTVLATSSALAGSKQRHRWEGVAIGVGAAILGHAIYQAHRSDQPPQVVYVQPEPPRKHGRGHGSRHGHWEWQKTWVPPTYEKVWNPGHYDRGGHWVSGHWIDVQTSEGYWTKERVWIAANGRRGPY